MEQQSKVITKRAKAGKFLRETEASNKSRVQAMASENAARNKEELQWRRERANFICHLEGLKKRNAQLAFDLKAVIDEKEELITERDAYKCKAHRLNHELFVALRAKKTHPRVSWGVKGSYMVLI